MRLQKFEESDPPRRLSRPRILKTLERRAVYIFTQRGTAATEVAQTSQSDGSRVSKPAARGPAQPIGKSAIPQVGKPAPPKGVAPPENLRRKTKLSQMVIQGDAPDG